MAATPPLQPPVAGREGRHAQRKAAIELVWVIWDPKIRKGVSQTRQHIVPWTMLNHFAKMLLVSTSLSPFLGAVAVNQIAQGEPWTRWTPWLVTAGGCVALCWLILKVVRHRAEREPLSVVEIESSDKEVLAFLLTYLLPFIAQEKLGFTGEWLTGAYIIAILFLAVAHGGAYHFNPVMGLMGYHFYSVRTAKRVSSIGLVR